MEKTSHVKKVVIGANLFCWRALYDTWNGTRQLLTISVILFDTFAILTLNLLTTTIFAPPNNASKWQMGFNSAFKELNAWRDPEVFRRLGLPDLKTIST